MTWIDLINSEHTKRVEKEIEWGWDCVCVFQTNQILVSWLLWIYHTKECVCVRETSHFSTPPIPNKHTTHTHTHITVSTSLQVKLIVPHITFVWTAPPPTSLQCTNATKTQPKLNKTRNHCTMNRRCATLRVAEVSQHASFTATEVKKQDFWPQLLTSSTRFYTPGPSAARVSTRPPFTASIKPWTFHLQEEIDSHPRACMLQKKKHVYILYLHLYVNIKCPRNIGKVQTDSCQSERGRSLSWWLTVFHLSGHAQHLQPQQLQAEHRTH